MWASVEHLIQGIQNFSHIHEVRKNLDINRGETWSELLIEQRGRIKMLTISYKLVRKS
jgi:hypothetical protein